MKKGKIVLFLTSMVLLVSAFSYTIYALVSTTLSLKNTISFTSTGEFYGLEMKAYFEDYLGNKIQDVVYGNDADTINDDKNYIILEKTQENETTMSANQTPQPIRLATLVDNQYAYKDSPDISGKRIYPDGAGPYTMPSSSGNVTGNSIFDFDAHKNHRVLVYEFAIYNYSQDNDLYVQFDHEAIQKELNKLQDESDANSKKLSNFISYSFDYNGTKVQQSEIVDAEGNINESQVPKIFSPILALDPETKELKPQMVTLIVKIRCDNFSESFMFSNNLTINMVGAKPTTPAVE